MARGIDIRGINELKRMFSKLERVPQKVADKSAKAGGLIARKAAKSNAPVDTGNLKRGIISRKEKRVKAGKSVQDIMLSPKMNSVFVKESAAGKRSYYPASQEYGFMTVSGRYIPGYNYLKNSLDENAGRIEAKVLETAGKEVDKILNSR